MVYYRLYICVLSKIASSERQAVELLLVLISALALLQRPRNIESKSIKGMINGILPSVYLRTFKDRKFRETGGGTTTRSDIGVGFVAEG
jgi:hypothetical protein